MLPDPGPAGKRVPRGTCVTAVGDGKMSAHTDRAGESEDPGMSTTGARRLAQAEAAARRLFRVLESMAGTTTCDEVFSVVYLRWLSAERTVALQREGALAPPHARRS